MNKEHNIGYMNGGMNQMPNQGGFNPGMGMPFPNFPNQQVMPNLEERLNHIERSIRKLEARVNRLESPWQEATPYQTQDNSNMYMI